MKFEMPRLPLKSDAQIRQKDLELKKRQLRERLDILLDQNRQAAAELARDRERAVSRRVGYFFPYVSKADARRLAADPRAESVVGRLRLIDFIDDDLYHAALSYGELVNRLRQLDGLAAIYEEHGSATQELSDDDIRKMRTKKTDADAAVSETNAHLSHRHRNLHGALQHMVIDGHESRHMVEDLKVALTALVKHWRRRG